jgi:hypothetical protein
MIRSPLSSPLRSALSSAFAVRRGGGAPADPALSSPTVTVLNETSASAAVTFNKSDGIVYWIASTSATQPTPTQIKAGQTHAGVAAAASGSQAVDASGVQAVFGNVNGLTAGTTYYMHFYAETDALVGASIVSTGAFVPADVTGPVLSSAEGTQTGATTANLTVNTDTGAGTLYWVATTSATAPSAAQIIAGQNHLGAAAVNGSRSVTASGPQAFGITGLTGSTTYWAHFLHRDVALNNSNVTTVSASFTTTSVTYYFQAFNTGAVPANQQTNSSFTTNYTDSVGGSNAVLWSGDALGTGTAEQVRVGPNVTWVSGNTRMRCKLKVINKVASKMWLRVRAENVTGFVGTITHIDITDDGTADGSRTGGTSDFANVSVTSLGSGWFQLSCDTNTSSASDFVGSFFFYMATAAGGFAIVNNVTGNDVAIHDMTFEQL